MNLTIILAEIVIIGLIANTGLVFLYAGMVESSHLSIVGSFIKEFSAVFAFVFISMCYFTGNMLNSLSHKLFNRLDHRIRKKIFADLDYKLLRYKIYQSSDNIKSFLDIRYSILRLYRSSILSLFLLGIGLIVWNPNGYHSFQNIFLLAFPFILSLLSFLTFLYQSNVFYKSVYHSSRLFVGPMDRQNSIPEDAD